MSKNEELLKFVDKQVYVTPQDGDIFEEFAGFVVGVSGDLIQVCDQEDAIWDVCENQIAVI